MNLPFTVWICIILLASSFKRLPLLPADCLHFIPLGKLAVEPGPLFLLGSNLTVYCQVNENQKRSKLSLELNKENVKLSKRINSTTTVFFLPHVWMPQSSVVCKMKREQLSALSVVNGLNLRGGLPPDKPKNIICETTRTSKGIRCSWQRGTETHLPKSYSVSVSSKNGTQIHFNQTREAEEITIPRAVLDENTKHLLMITASNHFGASQSDPFVLCVKDIVIPETPHIINAEFETKSIAAMLHWETAESSVRLVPCIRVHADNVSWEEREGTELSEGLIRVDNLRPLTEYEFQMRTCNSTSALACTNAPSFITNDSQRSLCSKWSPSVKTTSPGKSPSQQLQVWRILSDPDQNGMRIITVLWKSLPPEDYSGDVQHYKIFLSNSHEETCGAASPKCSVKVPAGVQALNVCAVTLYGMSPPANVELRHSDVLGPHLYKLVPAPNGDAVLVSWLSTFGAEMLYYVIECASVPATTLQWKKLAKDARSTSFTGLTAGVRYNVSLYAVTTGGVSVPNSSLIYSREQKPVSGPNVYVLFHEARRIQIQWDELPVDQQRGFITKYTIYMQTLDSSKTELNVTVSASSLRQMWLDCPEGALALQLTMSNSAGEGPRGRLISSQGAAPAVDQVIVIVFLLTVFIMIVVNLMCWSCVRERIKQKCISWGPAWLVENLPKPGHSNAIRLLEDDRTEPVFSSTDSDPPLSPISVISQEERDEVYPIIHVEMSQIGSEQTRAETHTSVTDTGTIIVEHYNYKPHITALIPPVEEVKDTEEMHRDVPAEEDSVFKGLLKLLSVDVDFSDSSRGLTLGSVTGFLWPKTAETSLLHKVLLQERRGSKEHEEADSLSLELQQDNILTPHTTESCFSQYAGEATLNGGYFPQVAAVSTTVLETQK
ncbi:interleukin-23 receptor [Melanotaenia boesemani]|uniref:interleukin-23 receptor n=1 Tax=Melanotaenia boesemani TaxID=1250792 RepID=UPI001C03E732|nr:interleukin-23 receptor [Melanotaenia boesemani]XP_041862596.1 interleukin-23 receptor [Melanotaenia boesemani]